MTFCETPRHLPCGPHPSHCEKRANAPKRSRQTDRVTKWQTRSGSLLPRISYASTSYHLPIEQISFTYRFRIVSASVSENDRRTIGGRYENNTGLIRNQYGINTRTIRERYENDRMRLLTDVLGKKLNFSIVMYLDYILHCSCLLCSPFHTAMADASLAKAQQLYKDNPASC